MDTTSQGRFVSRAIEATKARQAGDTEQAKALMNEAIKLLKSIVQESPDLYSFRELVLTDIADLPETNWDKVEEAIKLFNSTGKESPGFSSFRQLLLTNMADLPETNWDKVEEAINEACELYKQQGDILGQIDTLISLAGLSLMTRKTEAARKYLDQAYHLIDVTPSEIINDHLPDRSLLTGENVLQLRQAEVNRLREFLV